MKERTAGSYDELPIVDTHHHLWDLKNNWYQEFGEHSTKRIWGTTAQVEQRYTIEEYLNDTRRENVVKSVHVQVATGNRDALAESRWLQKIAERPGYGGFPHAIVPWVDLAQPDFEQTLDTLCQLKNVRGVRQIACRNQEPLLNQAPIDFLNNEDWLANIGALVKHGLTFDLQITTPQLSDAVLLARRHPDLKINLLHFALPIERHKAGIDLWRRGMCELSKFSNVYCKLSGFGLTDFYWSQASIERQVNEAIEYFGIERCMFGSNFPIDKIMRPYEYICDSIRNILKGYNHEEKTRVFSQNAQEFYRI